MAPAAGAVNFQGSGATTTAPTPEATADVSDPKQAYAEQSGSGVAAEELPLPMATQTLFKRVSS